MTREEAISWAYSELANLMSREFYESQRDANKAARAMSVLSGHNWAAQKLTLVSSWAVIPKP